MFSSLVTPYFSTVSGLGDQPAVFSRIYRTFFDDLPDNQTTHILL